MNPRLIGTMLVALAVAPTSHANSEAERRGTVAGLRTDCQAAITYVDKGFKEADSKGLMSFGFCIGYIWAFLENPPTGVCVPTGVDAEQGARVFLKWADENPDQHHISRPMGLWIALRQAFQCGENQGSD